MVYPVCYKIKISNFIFPVPKRIMKEIKRAARRNEDSPNSFCDGVTTPNPGQPTNPTNHDQGMHGDLLPPPGDSSWLPNGGRNPGGINGEAGYVPNQDLTYIITPFTHTPSQTGITISLTL